MRMDFLEKIDFYNGLSATIKAVILLVIALIAAAIARAVVRKIVEKFMARKADPDETAEMAEAKQSIASILGNITFAVVFLLFLPGALDHLKVTSVSEPLRDMATKFLDFLPNIIAAVVIIVFGVFLARLLKQLLLTVLGKTKLDSLQEKCGVKENNGHTFSGIIANLVYAVVLLVFVVAAIQVLNLKAISEPATSMVSMLFEYIPLVFAALVIILFGVFLANIVEGLLVSVLAGTGLDGKAEGLFPKKEDGTRVTTASRLIGLIVKIVIDVFFIVAAINVLQVDVLTEIGRAVIAYMPNVLAAVIIVLVAWICSNKAYTAIAESESGNSLLALITKIAIIALAAFMAVSQLGIAKNIIFILFLCIAGALAGAFVISFGIGGRSWAAKKLEDMDKKLKK